MKDKKILEVRRRVNHDFWQAYFDSRKQVFCILANRYPVHALIVAVSFTFLGLVIGYSIGGPMGCSIGVAITAGICLLVIHKVSGASCDE
ncbi:MAG: hypothetical protein V4478_03630 [Patescibacteria group bacterium]